MSATMGVMSSTVTSALTARAAERDKTLISRRRRAEMRRQRTELVAIVLDAGLEVDNKGDEIIIATLRDSGLRGRRSGDNGNAKGEGSEDGFGEGEKHDESECKG